MCVVTGAEQPVGQAIIQELAGMLSSLLCWWGGRYSCGRDFDEGLIGLWDMNRGAWGTLETCADFN